MERKPSIILVPGLGDNKPRQQRLYDLALSRWKDFDHTVHLMGWHDGESYQPKLTRLLDVIDRHVDEYEKVSLVSVSAGTAGVGNAVCEKINELNGFVSLAGRVSVGKHKGFRSFETRSKSSPSWVEAVLMFEDNEKKLTPEQRKKIMTIRAWRGMDELVPADTTIIEGAYNIEIPMIEHMATIYSALTLYRRLIFDFLDRN